MNPVVRAFLIGVVITLAALAVGAYAFTGAGMYPIGADAPHSSLTLRMVERLRDASTSRAARSVQVPTDLDDPALIATGAREYAEECTGCHLAPGRSKSELRDGLYPQPPNLAEAGIDNDAEAFWIIKHGIKMSAMPAWGRTLDDRRIWALVAFVRKMPKVSPAEYHAMAGSATAAKAP